jgi:hypothetical protein
MNIKLNKKDIAFVVSNVFFAFYILFYFLSCFMLFGIVLLKLKEETYQNFNLNIEDHSKYLMLMFIFHMISKLFKYAHHKTRK